MQELSQDTSLGWRRRQRAAQRLDLAEVTRGLVVARVSCRPRDVVFVKGVFEASEGLALVFAERGGELAIASSPELRAELDRVLSDLVAEGHVERYSVVDGEPSLADDASRHTTG